MFGWFERRLNPYPEATPLAPPEGLVAFCWHYSREAAPWLMVLAVLTALIAIGEVMLFRLGPIVDWLAKQPTPQKGSLHANGAARGDGGVLL